MSLAEIAKNAKKTERSLTIFLFLGVLCVLGERMF